MKLQQGDVILKKVAKIPQGAKHIKKRPLALGEFTGHSHQIIEDIEMYEKDGVLYIKSDRPVNLKHEEHGTVSIPEGLWQVGIVQEYDPFAEEARNVQD